MTDEGNSQTKIDDVIALLDAAKADLVNVSLQVQAARITGMTVTLGAKALGVHMGKLTTAGEHIVGLIAEIGNLDGHIDDCKKAWNAAKGSSW